MCVHLHYRRAGLEEFPSDNKCIIQMMFTWVNCIIGFHVDYTRLVYYRRQFWNRSNCYMCCVVYNTLKESKLGFWTVVEPVAYFATFNTSIYFKMPAKLLSWQSSLGFVPRVIIYVGCTTFPFQTPFERSRLGVPLKSALVSLDWPCCPLLLEIHLLSLPPKRPCLPK